MSDHIKRLAAPKTWPIAKKENVFSAKPMAGAHSVDMSVTAVFLLRDITKVCDSSKEAERIVADRNLIVDGKPVREIKAPIGFMDVVEIPKMDLRFRMLLNDKGKFVAVPISADEAKWKLCRIENKTRVAKGKIQLNLHDGRNILLEKNQYKTGDVLKVEVPSQKILDCFELSKGASAMIFKGNYAGKPVVLADYIVTKNSSENVVKFDDGTETVKGNVFVIGKDKAEIKLPEVNA